MENTTNKLSPFALALRRLLDDTAYFTRAEWARFLGVSESALSQWVNDKTIPRADLLRVILDVLRSSANIPPEPLTEFDKISNYPAEEVSPLGSRMVPTVSDYIRKSTFVRLGNDLRRLSPEQQQRVLAEGSWEGTVAAQPQEKPATQDSHPHFLCDLPGFDRRKSPLDLVFWDITLLPHLQIMEGERRKGSHVNWQSLLSSKATLIVGEPGCGKSAIISSLFQEFRDKLRSSPILIRARSYWDRDREPLSSYFINSGIRGPILVDGLDEVPAERLSTAIDDLTKAAERLREVQFFVTSRPVSQLYRLKGFEVASVAPLTTLQVVLWLKKAYEMSGTFVNRSDDFERFVCHLFERPAFKSRPFRNPLFLRTAWTLFLRNAITPFAEAEVVKDFVNYLLYEWDRERHVIRVREPWASPQILSATLGEICLRLVNEQRIEFDTNEAQAWVRVRIADVPLEQLLSILSVQSGVLTPSAPNRWRVADDYFLSYFAAAHAIESSGNALQYLSSWKEKDRNDIRDVLRIACGITTDATPLLTAVLEARDTKEAECCDLLARILAQPIMAASNVVSASCSMLVSWLDKSLERWRLVRRTGDNCYKPEILWGITACTNDKEHYDSRVSDVLSAMHQARSGPARMPLLQQLRNAKSPVLLEFADSLEVEGHLRLQVEPTQEQKQLRAIVVPPIVDDAVI